MLRSCAKCVILLAHWCIHHPRSFLSFVYSAFIGIWLWLRSCDWFELSLQSLSPLEFQIRSKDEAESSSPLITYLVILVWPVILLNVRVFHESPKYYKLKCGKRASLWMKKIYPYHLRKFKGFWSSVSGT